tara:strand:- start:49 stop:588 length:540 start_codon:yes stop_codon:yes gene_type:complete
MQLKETQDALNKFAKYVIQQSRTNLTKGKKNSSKELYNSLDSDVKVSKNSFQLEFLMEQYGIFQDKGVRGAGGVRKTTSKFNRRNNKGKIWKQKGGNSPFSFKEGRKPSVKHFKEWSKRKGLSAYAVRDAVFRQGIKPSMFFTKPFEKAFKNLPKELVQSFALDMETLLETTIKDNLKK